MLRSEKMREFIKIMSLKQRASRHIQPQKQGLLPTPDCITLNSNPETAKGRP